jgi:cell surface protein
MDGNPFLYWNGILTVLSSSFFYANDVLIDNVKKTIIAFRNKESSYIIPNSITGIGPNTFSHCETLSNIFIPNSVTSIGDNAFWGCKSISSIVIPNSVTSIGDNAFGGCTTLSKIVIPNSMT